MQRCDDIQPCQQSTILTSPATVPWGADRTAAQAKTRNTGIKWNAKSGSRMNVEWNINRGNIVSRYLKQLLNGLFETSVNLGIKFKLQNLSIKFTAYNLQKNFHSFYECWDIGLGNFTPEPQKFLWVYWALYYPQMTMYLTTIKHPLTDMNLIYVFRLCTHSLHLSNQIALRSIKNCCIERRINICLKIFF